MNESINYEAQHGLSRVHSCEATQSRQLDRSGWLKRTRSGRSLIARLPAVFSNVAIAFLFLIIALPARAQFEVAPDHFDNRVPQASTRAAAETEQAVQAVAQRRRLEVLQAKLKAQTERVEEALQAAISAGIEGDGAASAIDAYEQEKKALNRLTQALTPQLENIKAELAALEIGRQSVAAMH